MKNKSVYVSQALSFLDTIGLTGITPIEINDGGNLIIHLSPYPFVARISTTLSEEDPKLAYQVQERELQVTEHLRAQSVPVLLYTDAVDAGPHNIGGSWMTLWKYEPRASLLRPSPAEAIELIESLSDAMECYTGELPSFGMWESTHKSAFRLRDHSDPRVQALLDIFQRVDIKMRHETDFLVPCHGDANIGNLFPSNNGWIWMDFENVSLMPRYWDLASFICILALFKGIQEPTLTCVLDKIDRKTDLRSFGLALVARTLTSTLGNLDYALIGHGDMDFAIKELELAEGFIKQIVHITGGDIIAYT